MKKGDVRPAIETLDALTGAMIPIPRNDSNSQESGR
jgi:hypothetical protein